MHEYISNISSKLLIHNYNNLKNNKYMKYLKIEYFIYFRFYFIYIFLIFFEKNQFIDYSIILHLQYILSITHKKMTKLLNNNNKNNIYFLDKISDYLFVYLFSIKVYFKKDISFINKTFMNLFLFVYFFLFEINNLYKDRLDSINKNSEFKHYLKILFYNPKIDDINKIIESTNIFNLSNFYIFINVLCFLLYN